MCVCVCVCVCMYIFICDFLMRAFKNGLLLFFLSVDEILINILVFFNHIFIVAQYLKINVNIT